MAKGHKGQKKIQGRKLKAQTKSKKAKVSTAKAKKGGSKAVTTNLKKIAFDNSKKIEALSADVTKVLLAPPKLNFLSAAATAPAKAGPSKSKSKKKPAKDDDLVMEDLGAVAEKFAAL